MKFALCISFCFIIFVGNFVSGANGKDGKILRVTSILSSPFLTLANNPNNVLKGNDRYSGYIKDLLDHITRRMDVNYTLELVADGYYGMPAGLYGGNGSWNGMIKELMTGKADVAAADLTKNYIREQVVDFTAPYMTLGITLLMNKKDVTSVVEDSQLDIFFLKPFSYPVWICLVVAVLVITILFYLINRFDPYEHCSRTDDSGGANSGSDGTNKPSILGWLVFVWGGLTLQGYTRRPQSAAGVLLSAIWWSFSIIFLATYIMGMVSTQARAMFSIPGLKVRSLGDLLEQPDISVGCISGGSTMTFFQTSRIPVYRKTWNILKDFPHGRGHFVKSTQEAMNLVSAGGFAYLGESTIIDYAVRRSCNLIKVGGQLDSKSFALAVPQGSPLRQKISDAILMLGESGVLAILKTKWWQSSVCQYGYEVSPAMFHPSESPQFRSRETIDLSTAKCNFIFLIIGICLALVTFAVEVVFFKRSGAGVQKQDDSTTKYKNIAPLQIS